MKLDFIPFGAQYYRAPTPERNQWRSDLANMAERGFNTMKFFALWRWNNPAEGVYDFSDLDELMDIAGELGLKAIINVLFDVTPAWFSRKYHGSAMVTCDGRRVEPQVVGHRSTGGAPGPCYNHAEGLRCRLDFLQALVRRFEGHPALFIWDLWNEPELTCGILRAPVQRDMVCYCESCRARFLQWLNVRCGSLEELNARWHRRYQCWEEVELPRSGDAFIDMIDWRAFFADVLTGELKARVEAVRAAGGGAPVMAHTVPPPHFNAVTCCNDDYGLAAQCDLFGNSIGSSPFAAAFNTSCADGKLVINSEIHALGGSTYNRPREPSFAEIKAHIFTPLARGIKGFVYWQYRPERLGLESPAWGLTAMDGGATPWLEYNATICRALQRNARLLLDARPLPAEVALVNSFRGQVFDWCASGSVDTYTGSVTGLFGALYAAGLNVDIVGLESLDDKRLARYRAVVLPFPYCLDGGFARMLKDWVARGGLLVSEAFFGAVCGDNGLHETAAPGLGFAEVFGAREGKAVSFAPFQGAYAGAPLPGQTPPVPVATAVPLGSLPAGAAIPGYLFQQELVPAGAEALCRFENGAAAATRHAFGKGSAVLVGTLLGCAYHKGAPQAGGIARLLAGLLAERGIVPGVETDSMEARADLLTAPDGGAVLVVNAGNPEATQFEVTIRREIGDKKEAVDLLTDSRLPLIQTVDGWKLAIPLEPNHHAVYRLA